MWGAAYAAGTIVHDGTPENGTKAMDLVSGGAWGSARHNLGAGALNTSIALALLKSLETGQPETL